VIQREEEGSDLFGFHLSFRRVGSRDDFGFENEEGEGMIGI